VPNIEVPPLPVAHAKAMRLLHVTDPSVKELEQIIELDPKLTAAVLRMANSAASAPLKRVETAHAAIVRIGTSATRRITIAAALDSSFPKLWKSGLNVDELWRHLVACAMFADQYMGHRPGEHSEAFTAGLLHDIGRLAMATQDPDRYSIVVAMARSGIDTITAERKVFGLGHVEWGGAVAREWQFPEDVTLAITDHHQGVAGRLSVAVSVARRAAASLGIGDGVAGPEPPPGNAKAADDDIIENADAVLRDLHSYVHALRAVA
jgi:putative nucleotidyltransferase with HDIG domain